MKKTKICTKCGKRKPISEFSTDNSKKDGKKNYCKECAREMDNKRRSSKKRLADAKDAFVKSLDEEVEKRKAETKEKKNVDLNNVCKAARLIDIAVSTIAEKFGLQADIIIKLKNK